MNRSYRRVRPGEDVADAVTLGVERHADGRLMAAVWWPSRDDIDADEAEYDDVPAALEAAEASRLLHGFAEVVVVLQADGLWDPAWGQLSDRAREPIGDLRGTDLSEDEALDLATGIEAERDA